MMDRIPIAMSALYGVHHTPNDVTDMGLGFRVANSSAN